MADYGHTRGDSAHEKAGCGHAILVGADHAGDHSHALGALVQAAAWGAAMLMHPARRRRQGRLVQESCYGPLF
jgi:hypothetical protein